MIKETVGTQLIAPAERACYTNYLFAKIKLFLLTISLSVFGPAIASEANEHGLEVWTKNALFPQGHICIDAPCPDLVLSGESDEPEEESKGAPKQATGNLAEDSTRGDAEYGSDKTEK